ncbi:MAG: TolC family protein [Opitutae bacterium]|nr:TolC family protein [Opitutae bacterium]
MQKLARVIRAFRCSPRLGRIAGRLVTGVLIAGGLGVAALAQPVDPAKTLPEKDVPVLAEIIAQALRQSPRMLSKSLDLAKADAERIMAGSGRWPSLGGDARAATGTVAVSNTQSTREEGFFYNIGLNQALYRWGTVRASNEIGILQQKIAQRQNAEVYRGLVVEIRNSFLNLIYQKKALQLTLFNLQTAEHNFAALQERNALGLVAANEFGAAQLSMQEQRLAVARLRSTYDNGKRMLVRLAGLKSLADESIPDTLARPDWTEDQAVNLVSVFEQSNGVTNTPSAMVLNYSIRKNELDYRIAKMRLRPMVNFFASMSVQNQSNISVDPKTNKPVTNSMETRNQSVGVVANWSIFDGFYTRGMKLRTLADKRLAERQLQTHVETVNDQIRSLTEQLNLAAQGVALSEQRLEMSKGGLAFVQEEVKQGRFSANMEDSVRSGVMQAELTALANRIELYSRWSDLVSLLWVDPMIRNLPASYLDHDK